MSIRRRIDRLVAAAPPACPAIEWHDRWHVVYEDVSTGVVPEPPRCAVCGAEGKTIRVVYEDMDSGETPAPPSCPTCNAPPDLTITVGYEREAWRRLNDVSELRRTSIEW